MPTDQTGPIAVQVIRYRCPHCPRSGSSKARVVAHMAKCWRDPVNRGCKTCANFSYYDPPDCDGPESPEYCLAGVALPVVERDYGSTTTLMIHCDAWEAAR
jgi:hypothetical protein